MTGVTSAQQESTIISAQGLSDKDDKIDHPLVEQNGKVATAAIVESENISAKKQVDGSDLLIGIRKEDHMSEEENGSAKNSYVDSGKNFNFEKLSDSLNLNDARSTDQKLLENAVSGSTKPERTNNDNSDKNEKDAGLVDDVFSRTTSGSCTPEPFLFEDSPEPELEGKLPLLDAVLGYINSAVCNSFIIIHKNSPLCYWLQRS